MKANVEVKAGVCGFVTRAAVTSEDNQYCSFEIASDCEKIRALTAKLVEAGPVDAFQEISPAGESVVLASAQGTLKGCCAACAVPVGLFKAMQVAAGLALPQAIAIDIATE